MKTLLRVLLTFIISILALGRTEVCAATTDEVVALVKEAADYVKANGKEKAFAEFNNPQGKFHRGELYVFVNDYEGLTLAHGGNPKLLGQNNKDLADPTGKLFMQAMIEKARGGGGWVDYKWTNPTTKKLQDKASYVLPLEGLNAFVACGIYKTAP
jgi:signal transduction histidine kinase